MRTSTPTMVMLFHFSTLLLASIAVIYSTLQNIWSVETLADQSLKNVALAISSSAERALRENGAGSDNEMLQIFSDRVVAYALIIDQNGQIRFHTNPHMVGSRIEDDMLQTTFQDNQVTGNRITLQTGLPAYEFNYILQTPSGNTELLRLVLHTLPADLIVSRANKIWWAVALMLLLLWATGILFNVMFFRSVRLQKDLDQRRQMALIGQMTGVLAHEVRNALGSIKGYTQWVNEKVTAEDPKKEGLARVLQGIHRIESLVTELLLFSRDEIYSMRDVDLSTIIGETISSMPPWQGNIEISVEPGTHVRADKVKLRRVLVNCIQNSLQAMGDRGVLTLSGRRDRHYIWIYIKDSGHGIPESELPRLFSPYHTTKPDGIGLGLAYSKKIVEGMGGKITMSNRTDGTGAKVTITLEAAKE